MTPSSSPTRPAAMPACALLAAGILTLLVSSLWAGLLRLGWTLPLAQATLAAHHGPLIVCGLLGTVIGLERAVALGRPWAFIGPLLTLASGFAMLMGLPASLAALLMAGGSLGLLAVFVAVIRRQPARFIVTMALGLVGLVEVRRWGGMLNAVAIMLFLLLTAASVLRAYLSAHARETAPARRLTH